jgi:exosortase
VLLDLVKARKLYLACALIAVSFVVWWHPLRDVVALALTSDAHTHILLIVPLSIVLGYFRVSGLPDRFVPGTRAGAFLLAVALLLRSIPGGNHLNFPPNDRLSLSIFALVLWWIGSVVFCFGVRVFRTLLFPLAFLFLIVPFPTAILDWITRFLQNQSAWGASMLFHLARVPVARDGVMLSIPGLDIEVATECSSIRSSMMLIVTTMFLAGLFLQSVSRKAVLILAAVPLSVAKNALRIFVIAELGTRVNPAFLDGWLHHKGGIVFFGIALLEIVFALCLLRRSELSRGADFSASPREWPEHKPA